MTMETIVRSPPVIVRGATVVFTVTFLDIDGDPTHPDSATLFLNYKRNRQAVDQQITMLAQANGTSAGTWDSSDADAGQLEWHVRSDDTYIAALQGAFRLDINRANPDV